MGSQQIGHDWVTNTSYLLIKALALKILHPGTIWILKKSGWLVTDARFYSKHFLFSSTFNLHVFINIPLFFLWLNFCFILMWPKGCLTRISVFLNLLRLLLWPNLWSLLEKFPCALEKNVYSLAFVWKILNMSIKFFWSNMLFKASVSSLIFWLDHLLIS